VKYYGLKCLLEADIMFWTFAPFDVKGLLPRISWTLLLIAWFGVMNIYYLF
jgi:hypothetical protein